MAEVQWRVRLVGRTNELARLESERRRAASGEFRCVLVIADPGVGKSRLVTEFLAPNKRRLLALSARAYPLGSTASFGPWAEALEAQLNGLNAVEISKLCGGFMEDLAALVPSVAAARGSAAHQEPPKVRLLEGISALIGRIASSRPLAIFLDDVHLADASSWEELAHLARHAPHAGLLVVVAARPAELSAHPVASEVLLGLEQEGLLSRLDLAPLNRDALVELAAAVIGHHPPPPLQEWLAERSRGNPLFALSLMQGLLEEKVDLSAPESLPLPRDLKERIALRLKSLTEAQRGTVELLAVVGGRVQLGDLVMLSGRPLEAMGVILEELSQQRLVVEQHSGRALSYELVHPLIQEAIYHSIGAARRRALHRAIARSLLASGQLGAAAPHFALSADVGDGEAIDALCGAIRQAEEREIYRESLMILRALVELLPAGDRRWLEVLDAMSWQPEWVVDHRADAHAAMGIQAMRQIDKLVESVNDPERRATVKFRLASFLAWGMGDLEEAEKICTDAKELFVAAGNHASTLIAANELAWMKGLKGDAAGLEEGARKVVEEADREGDSFALLQGLAAWCAGASWRGRFEDSILASRRGIAIAQREGKLYRATIASMSLAISLSATGEVEKAQALVDEAKAQNPEWRESPLLEWESLIHWLGGNFPASLSAALQSIKVDSGPPSKRRAVGFSFAALAAVEVDKLKEARDLLAIALQAYGDRPWAFYTDHCTYCQGVLEWRTGDTARSLDLLSGVVERMLAMQVLGMATFPLVELAQVSAETGEASVACRAASQLQQVAKGIGVQLHSALSATATAWAALAQGERDTASQSALQAIATLSTMSYPFYRARAHEVLAHAVSDTDRASATKAFQAAAEGFGECGAVWRRSRVIDAMSHLGSGGRRTASRVLGPDSLTRREREVAGLAAKGYSARQIGERLFIGERTVESHLANAYAKLGVSSKIELVRREAEFML